MKSKKVFLGLMGLVLVLTFGSCATMIHTEEANVSASSGANATVEVMDNGVPIYNGTLPAQFPVISGHTYNVNYSTPDGEKKVFTIGERFNGWFIGSLLLGLFPGIVDLVTDNIMQIEATTVLPINYSPMIILGENIPYHQNLRYVGRLDSN